MDFAKRIVHVRRSIVLGHEDSPKSHKVRSVPLIDQAARALDGLSRREHFTCDNDYVFINDVGDFLSDDRLRRRFKTALENAGLPAMRLHDLRHTFGTLAVQVFPLSDVQVFMGHADIATTMIYVHHVPQHDAADKLGGLVKVGVCAPVVHRTTDTRLQLSATRVSRLASRSGRPGFGRLLIRRPQVRILPGAPRSSSEMRWGEFSRSRDRGTVHGHRAGAGEQDARAAAERRAAPVSTVTSPAPRTLVVAPSTADRHVPAAPEVRRVAGSHREILPTARLVSEPLRAARLLAACNVVSPPLEKVKGSCR